MANNPYVNKVQLADGTSLIDISSDTVTADKLMQGYTAHDRTGALITGTATGGGSGGNVWQDAQGYVHLDDEGTPPITVESLSVTQNGTYTAPTGTAYSPVAVNVSGGGGLVYEAGTYTPAEDISRPTINFSNAHTDPPILIMMSDNTGTYDNTTYSNYMFTYMDWYKFTGRGFYASSSSRRYGAILSSYRNTSTSNVSFMNNVFNYNSDDASDSSVSYPRYFATSSDFKPSYQSSAYWRAGRTYKWIAVWAPTT